MVHGPAPALAMLEPLLEDPSCATTTGCTPCTGTCSSWTGGRRRPGRAYATAARLATSIPEQRYLNERAAALPAQT